MEVRLWEWTASLRLVFALQTRDGPLSDGASVREDLRGIWRHYKGHLYEVVGVGKHTETLEEVVTYCNLQTGEMWTRPLSMWHEKVDGRPRFERVGSASEFWSADKPIPEDDAIAAAHPLETGNHALYGEAMRLVGAKHSKYALVDLVNWLLTLRRTP